MPAFLRRYKKTFLITASLFLVLLSGMGIGYFSSHVWSENGKFETFCREIFKKEVSENMLTLHYSLAHPEKEGITRPAPVLGTVSADMSDTYKACENHLNKLKSFSASRLSRENQITLDMLLLYFHTRLSLKGNELSLIHI